MSRAEQRAEILRKQFIELVEKESEVKSRLVQMEENMRPENIERGLNLTGSARAPELRDNRRRELEIQRDGLQNVQNQIYQNHQRLENAVQDADSLVSKLRKLLFPIIEAEIQTIGTN